MTYIFIIRLGNGVQPVPAQSPYLDEWRNIVSWVFGTKRTEIKSKDQIFFQDDAIENAKCSDTPQVQFLAL